MSATYPEHEKFQKIADKSQSIGEFLEWAAAEKGLHLAGYVKYDDAVEEVLTVAYNRVQDLLAEFFDIDQKVLEQEKRTMLDEMRKAFGSSHPGEVESA